MHFQYPIYLALAVKRSKFAGRTGVGFYDRIFSLFKRISSDQGMGIFAGTIHEFVL